jgi:hypothetical protein
VSAGRRGRSPRPALAAALATALTAALATGCGVPRDDAPRALAPAEAPFASPRATAVGDPQGPGRVPLHFVRDDLLVLAPRPVEGPVSDEQLLELLLGGTSPEESAAGLVTLIPPGVTVETVERSGGTAVVTLGGPRSEVLKVQALAYGQIVSTLTPARADGVRFRLDGADLEVPRGDNTLTAAPLSRDDYAALLAPAAPPAVPPADGPGSDPAAAVAPTPSA